MNNNGLRIYRLILITLLAGLHSELVFAAVGGQNSRYALVIGNSEYNHISKLRNAVNDARLMSKTLESVGFDVTLVENLDGDGMYHAVMDFGDKIINANAGEAALFYYSGHGIQHDGQSVLLPIDFDSDKPVPDTYYRLQDVLSELKGGAQKTKILIIDACREDASIGDKRLSSKDIANFDIPIGGTLAFSTGPSDVALDGTGRNSPYTDALTTAMKQQGLELSAVFRQTREEVLKRTKRAQSPTETSKAIDEFYFLAGNGSRSVVDYSKQDRDHWRRIKDSQAALDFLEYTDRFPSGEFADLAWQRYRQLEAFANPSDGDDHDSQFQVSLVYYTLPGSNVPVLKVATINSKSVLSGKLLKGDLLLQINHNPLEAGKDPNKLLGDAFSKSGRLDLLVKRGNGLYTLSYHQ